MTFRIECWDGHWGLWTSDLVGEGAGGFATEAEADAAIEELRTNGDDWEDAEYRVVDEQEEEAKAERKRARQGSAGTWIA